MARSSEGGGSSDRDTKDGEEISSEAKSVETPTETGSLTDGSGLYHPSPNPPFDPKPCQDCGTLVDGQKRTGWWLERECWQSPNKYELYCISCCVEKMASWPNYPDVDTEHDVKETLPL